MKTLLFAGYSDDTFGEVLAFNDDYDNCGSGQPIEWLVESPSEGCGLIVVGQHSPGASGSWLIGVSNYDPRYDDRPMPRWPMHLRPHDEYERHLAGRGFNPALVIEAPDDVTIRCLQRTEEPA